jgi:hypothetical protein
MKLLSNHRLNFSKLALGGALLASLYSGLSATAYASSAPAEEPAQTEATTEGLEVTLKINLGTIELNSIEPTQGRTAVMSFDLHLTLDPQTDPRMVKELEAWHHRLREQVVVAVRATEIHDFIDPDLKRFRRQILYRINRMLGAPIVTDALFANFTFSSQ